jgi:IMP cyclohydrolase
MAITLTNMIPAKFAEITQTEQYRANGLTAVIDSFLIVNNGSTTATISCHIVPDSGTASASNRVLFDRQLSPNESYSCPELAGKIIDVDSFISTIASVASTITITATGREITASS